MRRGLQAVALLASAASLSLAGAPPTLAARAPSTAEREAITAALPAGFRKEPVGCVWLDLTVSRSGAFALAAPLFLNADRSPCARYGANGFWILRRRAPLWRVVFTGSEPPPCSLGVPKDLGTGCTQ